MSVFRYIDRDKAIGFMSFYWWIPLRYWQFGIHEEVFFLHDLFRHSDMHRHGWDLGLRAPARVRHDVARLHQKGANRTDKFGSDFALTIDIQGKFTLRKTALFQTKLSKNYSATAERHQLSEALSLPEFAGRSFTMAIDRHRAVIRIQSVDVLAAAFPNRQQATMTFDTTEWVPSTEWFTRWLECDIGRPSTSFEQTSIERLLASHAVELPDGFPRYEPIESPLGDNVFIPEVWHHATIKISENA